MTHEHRQITKLILINSKQAHRHKRKKKQHILHKKKELKDKQCHEM